VGSLVAFIFVISSFDYPGLSICQVSGIGIEIPLRISTTKSSEMYVKYENYSSVKAVTIDSYFLISFLDKRVDMTDKPFKRE